MAKTEPAQRLSGHVSLRVDLPLEVAQWFEQRANRLYKSRGRYIRDLLISHFNRDREPPPSA